MANLNKTKGLIYNDVEKIVDETINQVGKNIIIGTPLGLGKANVTLNAFFKRAQNDPTISLTILTALTLEKPQAKSLLEKNFLNPFVERVFANTPELLYEKFRKKLPKNIRVIEFYFPPGKNLKNAKAQQDYISSNYTHVSRDLMDAGVNVLCQMVTPINADNQVSLSCNPDVTPDIVSQLQKKQPYPWVFIGEINKNLPFMYGEAVTDQAEFDFLLDTPETHTALFGPPKMSVNWVDHLIGLRASTLVKDDGEIQIGIGSLGDSLVHSLILRQNNNQLYQKIVHDLEIEKHDDGLIEKIGGLTEFTNGLFAASEMFVDGFTHLIDHEILKRQVYDHIELQRLINQKKIDETVGLKTIDELVGANAINAKPTHENIKFLKKFGILKADLNLEDEKFKLNHQECDADFNLPETRSWLEKHALGEKLDGGAILHGGFFLGCNRFYDWLRNCPESIRQKIHMKSVLKINQLYGHEEIDRLHRKDARFFNSCMMMTLLGAAVSDGLEDGRVVSGVGGQYNFVAMAQELPDGYSILQLRSTRGSGANLTSNIVFNYGHTTIPRHLRDIVITEYGIANLRGQSDQEVIKRLLRVADSRFQMQLLNQAKDAGKIDESYQLEERFRNNTPHSLRERFSIHLEHFPAFPFGCDFTEQELRIGKALKKLKAASTTERLIWLSKAMLRPINKDHKSDLERMNLLPAAGAKELALQKLLNYCL